MLSLFVGSLVILSQFSTVSAGSALGYQGFPEYVLTGVGNFPPLPDWLRPYQCRDFNIGLINATAMTFPAGWYEIELIAEISSLHLVNELYTYDASNPTNQESIFDGPFGGPSFGCRNNVRIIFRRSYEFGLAIHTTYRSTNYCFYSDIDLNEPGIHTVFYYERDHPDWIAIVCWEDLPMSAWPSYDDEPTYDDMIIAIERFYAAPVGGHMTLVNTHVERSNLMAPGIGLASTIAVATAAAAIYVKRVKRRKEKQ